MRKIISTIDVLMGAPRIEDTRISIYDIVSSLWYDKDIDQYIDDFKISKQEIKKAIIYCKKLDCQKNNVKKFCNGCILNTINSNDRKSIYNQVNNNLFIDDEQNFFVSENINDIEEEEFGFAGWYRAEHIYKDLFSPR